MYTETHTSPKLMIIAGEVSGDMHSAELVKHIRTIHPDTSFFGVGGPAMRAEGVETHYDISDMAVMGITEVLRKYLFFRRVFHEMLALANKRKPSAVILVDYPGFNLRFARRIHALGIKTIYYICPQVWAWNRSRIPRMAEFLDCLITLFPFEKTYFENTNLHVEFAGNPLVDKAEKVLASPLQTLPWNGSPRIALLPGSRLHEILRILPVMWASASIIEKKYPDACFIIPTPSQNAATLIQEVIKTLPTGPTRFSIVCENTSEVLRQADAAIVTSGTATVETALMLCPMIIAYKTAGLTYALGKMLVKVTHIGMVNIIAGHEICPEFIQNQATPEALANALLPLLDKTSTVRAEMIKSLKAVKQAMGEGNASLRAAEIVIRSLNHSTDSDKSA